MNVLQNAQNTRLYIQDASLYQNTSPDALPDSKAGIDQPRGMKEIRIEFGEELDDWEKSTIDSATMKWVVAGTGDGTKAVTFADLCRRWKRSGGAFFTGWIVATFKFVLQLIQALLSTTYHIDVALHNDPHLLSKGREVQMNTLIVDPIKRIAMIARFVTTITFGLITYPTLIVIDGLDEITGKDVQTDIIKIVGNTMKEVRLPLRFFVASRPEPHIVDAITTLQSHFPKDRISLMDLKEDNLVHRDIRRYFEVKFQAIRAKDNNLPQDWPGEDVIDQLVDKSSEQFIYAMTIVPYNTFAYRSPEERLEVIRGLFEKPGDEPYQNLDELYTHVVRDANRRADMLRIMPLVIIINRLIAVASAPAGTFARLCSPQKLDDILGLRRGDTRRCLKDVHAVVCVGADDRDIYIYHQSFSDFLLDVSRSNEFAVNVEDSYDCLFSYLIGTSKHRETILQVLGQCLFPEAMDSDVEIIGVPANTTSCRRIETLLGLENGSIAELLAGIRLLVEVENEGQDIRILDPSFRSFLLDRSRSRGLFVNLDDARLTLKLAAPIRKVFGAEVFSSIFPGPEMPWKTNSSLQLQDMYDQVYSHLIGTSQHPDTIVQVLGQCLVSEGMNFDLDLMGTPANTSSPNRIEKNLGLKRGTIPRLLANIRLLLEVGDRDQNIRICDPVFRSFLLDRSRSQGFFLDLDDARLVLKFAAPIRKVFGGKVYSSVFPGPQMPWHTNSSLQLQDMYDLVYSHLIRTSKRRDAIYQILGQVIISRSMPSDVGVFDAPSNSSSPKQLTSISGMAHGELGRVIADIHMLLELGDNDQDIRIRHASLLEFLLDLSRSRELFGNLDEALLTLGQAAIRRIFDTEVFSTVFALKYPNQDLVSKLLRVTLARCKAAGFIFRVHLEVLPNIIFGKYESLGRSSPWDRHPTTAVLKQICATLREDGFPGFGESDIETRLQMFWDTFTWETLSCRPSAPPRLTVFLRANPALLQEFFSAISDHKVSLPVSEYHSRINILLGTSEGNAAILFAPLEGYIQDSSIYFRFDSGFEATNSKDQWYVALAPYYAYGVRKERETQAWKTLTDALYNLRQKASHGAK